MDEQYEKQQRAKTTKDADFLSFEYLLPYDAELERSALGFTILNDAGRLEAMTILNSDDFHVVPYKNTFDAVVTLSQQGSSVTPITIAELMRKRGFLQAIGGVAGIASVASSPHVALSKKQLREYASKLRDLSIKRKAFYTAKQIALQTLDIAASSDDVLNDADEKLSMLRAQTATQTTVKTYKQVADEATQEIEMWRAGRKNRAIATGIPEFDRKLWAHGLARTELYYIAAITSLGKTALVWQLLNYFEIAGVRGIMFSLEMSAIMLLLRSVQRLSSGVQISPYTMRERRNGSSESNEATYGDYAYKRAKELLATISAWGGLIDDQTRSWPMIKAKIRQAHAEKPLHYVAGDYIQLCENTLDNRNGRRDLELAKISTDSKALAKELDVPFIWISQFSRLGKPGEKPQMNWLKETSQIEQDADFVGFLYEQKSELRFYCPKQRNGIANWELPMMFQKERQLFLTDELLTMLDGMQPNADEIFLLEHKDDRNGKPRLQMQQQPTTHEPQKQEQQQTTAADLRDDKILW